MRGGFGSGFGWRAVAKIAGDLVRHIDEPVFGMTHGATHPRTKFFLLLFFSKKRRLFLT
jgi:hypothetical protein